MANAGAKKRKEENEKHVRMLRVIILSANGVYILVRVILFYSSFRWPLLFWLLATSTAYYFCYSQIAVMAQPTYDERGELIDGGYNLAMGGLTGYYHDVIYLSAFTQVASIVSGYFWYLYLLIPAYAVWKLWQLVLYPYIFESSPEAVEDARAKKKREKQERQAARQSRLQAGRR